MRLPAEHSTPLVLVGPGTGCAIFRAFVLERLHLLRTGVKVGPAIFYFGCRHEATDFLYRELWMEALQRGALSGLSVAFSQDRVAKRYSRSTSSPSPTSASTIVEESYTLPATSSKTYVQACIRADANLLWNLISAHNASIFVCGNANKMPTDVRNAFVHAATTSGGLSDKEAESFVRNLEARHRYCVESWS